MWLCASVVTLGSHRAYRGEQSRLLEKEEKEVLTDSRTDGHRPQPTISSVTQHVVTCMSGTSDSIESKKRLVNVDPSPPDLAVLAVPKRVPDAVVEVCQIRQDIQNVGTSLP